MGWTPVVAPLLEIRTIPQVAPDLADVAALVFTSRNGVAALVDLFTASPSMPAPSLPVLTVGDATAEAARAAGFGDVRSAAGDLDDLAALIRSTWTDPAAVLLHPGAREPAGDLAAAVGKAAIVRALPVYEAVETGAAPPPAFDIVLLHSPRAAAEFARIVDAAGIDRAGIRIAAISARAADAAGPGWRAARASDAPTDEALLALAAAMCD